jgi:magnesium-transporting ATPase (P-type)
LLLLGSTAINDELQDNLKETLDFFLKTGIKVWVLTGDKFDTAKSIAYSSKLILPNNKIYEFNDIYNKDNINKKLNEYLLDYDLRENKNKKNNNNSNNYYNDSNYNNYNNSNENDNDNYNNYKDNINDSILRSNNSIELNNQNNQTNMNYKIRYSIIIGSEQLKIIKNDEILENKVYKNNINNYKTNK